MTHGIGAVLSVIGLILITLRSVESGSFYAVFSAVLFGSSLVVLYVSSTLYHAVSQPKLKNFLQTCDHVAIYFLIAGSYTPFCLISLGGRMGWWVFALIYICAAAGTVAELLARGHRRKYAVFFYLCMGWLAMFFIKPLMEALSTAGVISLVAGGVLYSAGTFFYARKTLRYNHAVWHLFVMAGSASHFYCIMQCVLIPHSIP